MERYYSYSRFIKEYFGEKLYKICIDGGFTCPNRDGTLATGGCIFCSEGGSGEFTENASLSVSEQIHLGKSQTSRKYQGEHYIAYFQAFTNTYAPVDRLRALYEEAITAPEIVALSIGTRPDCITPEILDLLEELNKRKREECPVSDLVVGLQCGGSDAFSGVTANPAVGYAADLLVRAGAKVMFSEVTEIRDAVHLLAPRTINDEVLSKLVSEMKWYDRYLEQADVDRDANPSPGNKKGGLSNVVDKALGSVAKSGSTRIVDVLSPGERIRKSGMTYAATPASDFVCGTQQLSSGITMQVFTTGRGTTYNLNVSPVIKVSTNSTLKKKWFDLIDVDAGTIATGEKTIEEVGWEIFNLILDVASDRKKTFADEHKIYNALAVFNPAPVT